MLVERNRCPDEFQARLTLEGGLNRYDQPNFRLVWGQTETFRAGGVWEVTGQPSIHGYRDLLIGSNEPVWILQQWQAPEKYGTPESYYVFNLDEFTNLQTLGEYPYAGRYESVMPLRHVWRDGAELKIETITLSSLLIDTLVPIIKMAGELTDARKKALWMAEKERQEKEQTNQIEAKLRDAFPAYGQAARSSAYLECSSVVQKKAEQIEKHWRAAAKFLQAHGKGLTQRTNNSY